MKGLTFILKKLKIKNLKLRYIGLYHSELHFGCDNNAMVTFNFLQ